MPVPSRRLKELIEGTVDHHASQRWPALEEVTISWRGSYGYLTGYLSEDDDDTIKLCRIHYLGDDIEWAFAIWQASSDSYADAVFLDGHRTGHPNQALDTACTLYLASPGDEPAEPLKDLRGAVLAVLTGLRERDDATSVAAWVRAPELGIPVDVTLCIAIGRGSTGRAGRAVGLARSGLTSKRGANMGRKRPSRGDTERV